MRPEQLQGEARRRFDTWCGLGLSEAAAMQQLRYDGVIESGSTISEADFDAQLARTFDGPAPAAIAPASMGVEEAHDVLLAAVFDGGTVAGAPVTAARVEEARRVVETATGRRSGSTSPLVVAVEAEADRLLTEKPTKGRGTALQEAWVRTHVEMVAMRADTAALASLDKAMKTAYPALHRASQRTGGTR